GMARSIWLFEYTRLNPKGLYLQPMIEALTARYTFAKAPQNLLDLTDNALAFKSGKFVNSKGVAVLVKFSIYDDGIIGETVASTDDSTEFLNDVASWAKEEFGLQVPSNARKAYASQIVFECDAPLLALSPKIAQLLRSVQARYQPLDGKPREFDFTGLSFWTEDVTKPLAPSMVKIERKIGPSFAQNMYFSQAPFETRSHIELLMELEALLTT
ncbi:MAG: hypothetical protein ACRD8A_19445, partial [Candidatus Acidiferrales bacterium]